MSAFFHALNITTLSAWLSVLVAGVAGLLIPDWLEVMPPEPEKPVAVEWKEPEIILDSGQDADTANETMPADPGPAAEPGPLPSPPEIPGMAAMEPLPDLPSLPPPPQAAPRKTGTPARPAQVGTPARNSPRQGGAGSGQASPGAAGAGGGNTAARLAGGRMPAPNYPAEARRQGQTGTVVIEFTIDNSGRVISAVAKPPSRWPLLNEEAVRTVRTWRFPPGGMMTIKRPIVFQLR